MDVGLDTGPMLATARCEIGPQDTGSSLHDRLAVLGGRLLAQHLDSVLAGELEPEPAVRGESGNGRDKGRGDGPGLEPARDLGRALADGAHRLGGGPSSLAGGLANLVEGDETEDGQNHDHQRPSDAVQDVRQARFGSVHRSGVSARQ